MIRKIGKARWVYECRACEVTVGPRVDQFTAIEAMNRHNRSADHFTVSMKRALEPFVDAFTAMSKTVAEVVEALRPLAAPPPNVPHDPALLKDRRKWGGR